MLVRITSAFHRNLSLRDNQGNTNILELRCSGSGLTMSGLREQISKLWLRSVTQPGEPVLPPADPPGTQETIFPTDEREGKVIGSYRILKRLGSGGMGCVYLAIDTRLGRHVALKFLSRGLLANQDMLNRLEQEARTASALNHPNILTIYEVVTHDNELFIASEYVDGVTLKRAVQRQSISPQVAIRIATQIASALEAAHSAGVIHRDLKPANVMMRNDGYIKVIDFGLAKLTEQSAVSRMGRAVHSLPGAMIGTVDYMSPEQARGEEVDARSDLWSLGVLLYEMLSGELPFRGETDSHVLVAILERPVPPLRNLSSLPTGAGRIVSRALMKDPAKRYGSALEMLNDLERIDVSSVRIGSPRIEKKRRRLQRTLWIYILFGFAVLCCAGGAIWWWLFNGSEAFGQPDWFRIAAVRQVTFNGRTLLSALSPDGKYLAFVVGDPGGMQSLHVKQVDDPSDEIRIPARKIDYLGLTFSPDSRIVYEVEEEGSALVGRLFAVPLVGDRPTSPVLEDIDGPVSFSSAGDEMAFVRYSHPGGIGSKSASQLVIASRDGGKRRVVWSTSDLTVLWNVAWSPVKNEIASVAENPAANGRLHLAIINTNGEIREHVLPPWNDVGRLAWSRDGKALFISSSSRTEAKSRRQIRELALRTGRSVDLTQDLNGYGSITASANNATLAAVRLDSRASVWVSTDASDLRHGRTYSAEVQDSATLAWLGHDQLLVNSYRTGFPNLSVLSLGNERHAALTNEPFVEQYGQPIPGTNGDVVFCSNRSGTVHIWRYQPASNKYTQITFGDAHDDPPSVSPDGKWLVYAAWAGNVRTLHRVSLVNGQTENVGSFRAYAPQISPDGKQIAANIQDERTQRWYVAVIPSEGGAIPIEVKGASLPFRWDLAGRALTSAIADSGGATNIWRIPVGGGRPKQLTFFEDQSIVSFAWSPEGRLACLRLAQGSDVVLFSRAAH